MLAPPTRAAEPVLRRADASGARGPLTYHAPVIVTSRRSAAWVATGATLSAGPAAAAAALELRVEAPPACPSAAALRAEAERAAADGPPIAGAPPLRALLRAFPVAGGFRGELTTGAPYAGARTFEGATCAEVASAAAFTLRLLLGRAPLAPAPPAAAAPGRWAPLVALAGRAESGLLPKEALSVRLVAGLTDGRLSFGGAAMAARGARAELPGDASRGATFVAAGAALWSCATPLGGGGWAAGVCGEIELLQVRGRGFGVAQPAEERRLVPRAGADAAIAWWPTSWLGATLGVGPRVSLARPRYHLVPHGKVHEIAAVSWGATIGIALGFGR